MARGGREDSPRGGEGFGGGGEEERAGKLVSLLLAAFGSLCAFFEVFDALQKGLRHGRKRVGGCVGRRIVGRMKSIGRR